MDLSKIITELRSERDSLNDAIVALERLAGTRRSRGRPPALSPADMQPEIIQTRAASAGSEDSGSAG